MASARIRLKGFIRTEGTVSFREASFMTLVVGWEREKVVGVWWVLWFNFFVISVEMGMLGLGLER